jgi:transcription antitermination factor NusG
MSTHWYALHCKPHKEACVAGQLGLHQIEYFYPAFNVRLANPRSQKIKPFFPGYLFVQLELGSTGSAILKWMPGTVGLVDFDNMPAPIPDNLITAIRQRVQMLFNYKRPGTGFKQGEAVQVVEGPLSGLRGIFDLSLSGGQRVRVFLKMIGEHFTRVELPAGIIEPIKQP